MDDAGGNPLQHPDQTPSDTSHRKQEQSSYDARRRNGRAADRGKGLHLLIALEHEAAGEFATLLARGLGLLIEGRILARAEAVNSFLQDALFPSELVQERERLLEGGWGVRVGVAFGDQFGSRSAETRNRERDKVGKGGNALRTKEEIQSHRPALAGQ